MASYRPKSLDDIKNSYDSERRAEKAIKRETERIEPAVHRPTSPFLTPPSAFKVPDEVKEQKQKDIEDISPAVDELIKEFSQPPKQKKPAKTERPLHGIKPVPQTEYSSMKRDPGAPKIISTADPNRHKRQTVAAMAQKAARRTAPKTAEKQADATQQKQHEFYSGKQPETKNTAPAAPKSVQPQLQPQPQPIAPPTVPPQKVVTDSRFSDLMSDYVKIMNDQDDTEEVSHRSLFRKRGRKKNAQRIVSEEPQGEQQDDIFDFSSETDFGKSNETSFDSGDSNDAFDQPLFEDSDFSKPEYETPVYEEQPQEPVYPETEAVETAENEEPYNFDNSYEPQAEEELIYQPEEDEATEPEPIQYTYDETAEEDFDENSDELFENSSDNSADEAENEESSVSDEEQQSEAVKAESKTKKTKNSSGKKAVKVLLSIVLVLCVIATAAVGSINIVFHVNEAVEGPMNSYYFTSDRTFSSVGVNAGDFVICSSSLSQSGTENVVYVDRENQNFTFGVKGSTVTAEDGNDYCIINGKAIAKENVIGRIEKTVPTVGTVISLIYANYTVILLALFAACVVLFLIISLALRNKEVSGQAQQASLDEEPESADDSDYDEDDSTKQDSDVYSGQYYDGEQSEESGDEGENQMQEQDDSEDDDNLFSDL
ncbi:MAG: hypothetical protein ACI4W6_07375 [Acutalibacteraceae bacterium]